MTDITQRLLKKLFELAGDRLSGDWIVMGGTVLPLLGVDYRVTNDIDLAGPKGATQDQLLILMTIAEKLGLPVEAINQAGAFFLYRVKEWKRNLVKVYSGKTATFYRPNSALFILLKIQRLSETDLADCLKILEIEKIPILEKNRVERELKSKSRGDSQQARRAKILLNAIKKREEITKRKKLAVP